MAMDSNGVEAAAASVATASSAEVVASSASAAVVEETKTTITTTITTTTSSTEEEVVEEEHASSSTTTTTTTTEALAPPPTAEDEEEPIESATATALSSTPPKAAGAKKWGLGGYLPKVPSLLKKPSAASTPAAEPSGEQPQRASSEDDAEEAAAAAAEAGDEARRSLSEQPAGDKEKENKAAPTVASRLRGLSIEQNAFARSLVGKINGFRAQSSMSSATDSPRHSLDGALPPQAPRRSLLGNVTGGVNGAATNVPSPRSDPNLKARRGACVATKFGTGTVLDIRLDDGFYIVQLVPKSIAYLREDMIIREIKAIVGERVKTRWGLATVEQYYADEDMYNIALDWRWDDDHVWRMKATTKKFEKISRGMSIVQNTKNRIFTGYSTIRESASYGYANVAAKINTTASTYKATPRNSQTQTTLVTQTQTLTRGESLGKALTPYGVCTVIEVRSDQFFVVKTKCGATGYLHADAVKLLHRRTNFALGERVKTPYGHGEVLAYRDEDEVYEVKLDITVSVGSTPPMLYISDIHAEAMMVPANGNGANYARLSSIFTMTRNSVYSASATVKASATGGLTTLSNVKSKVSTMAAIKMTKAKFQKGERVITSFGSGFVSDARPLERIYEVQLRRLKFRGYFHESALQHFPYERVTHFIVDGKTIPAPDMPKNLPEHKRRDIITTAIRQARNGR